MLARFRVTTTEKIQMIDITKEINEIITQSHVDSGMCTVFCAHTTAGVVLTETGDSNAASHAVNTIDNIVPTAGGLTIDSRTSALMKTMLTGNSVNIIVSEGRPLLGNWQGVFLCDFDGKKNRTVFVKVTSD